MCWGSLNSMYSLNLNWLQLNTQHKLFNVYTFLNLFNFNPQKAALSCVCWCVRQSKRSTRRQSYSLLHLLPLFTLLHSLRNQLWTANICWLYMLGAHAVFRYMSKPHCEHNFKIAFSRARAEHFLHKVERERWVAMRGCANLAQCPKGAHPRTISRIAIHTNLGHHKFF